MTDSHPAWKKIAIFIGLTFLISTVFYTIMYFTGSSRNIGAVWMWSPAISALVTQWMFHGSMRNFGWQIGLKRYLLWGLVVPLTYALIIYGISWITGIASFRPPSVGYLLFLPFGLLAACLAALGEEIGWRGLLVPELSKVTTITKAALLTGIVWAIWHYPAVIDDFGIGLVMAALILGFACWKKRSELSSAFGAQAKAG
jgi:membrane protease YdiL (CAAX protease family)